LFSLVVSLGKGITKLARAAVHLVKEATPAWGLVQEVCAHESEGNPDHKP
jgi:hypothetical protein